MVTPTGLVVLTDRRSAAGPLETVVRQAVRGGAAWVVLRERDLPYGERAALAERLRMILPPGRLIVAGPDPLGGSAVHLSGSDPVPAGVALVGRSWHGTENLSGVDYVTVSPVYPTASKPGYGPALGATGAAELRAPVPWLALGGIESAEQAAACVAAGAAGVAVMGAVMRSSDPERTARDLAEAALAGSRGSSADGEGGNWGGGAALAGSWGLSADGEGGDWGGGAALAGSRGSGVR
ncbi:thiamine phosphate synthase [Actinoplanes sp. NPDC024001]|uniref:thiamine phosphate synthase n=1 Tax=Actinoplanes sp. NPDC024001 TaxID=3154598 RepID=UPI0033F56403